MLGCVARARSCFARSAPLLPSSPALARRMLCSGAAALPWEPTRFKGATIAIEKPVDDAFEPKLVLALDELREAGRRGVWMRVPIEHSAAAAVAARHGFAFHHAEGGTAPQPVEILESHTACQSGRLGWKVTYGVRRPVPRSTQLDLRPMPGDASALAAH